MQEQINELSDKLIKSAVETKPKNMHQFSTILSIIRRKKEQKHNKEVTDTAKKLGDPRVNEEQVEEIGEELSEAEEQDHFKNAMDRINPEKRTAARNAYKTMRAKGHTHASALSTMHNMFSEETLDESDSGIDGSKDGPISQASSKHGRVKKMMGTSTIATKIATILAKGK